MSRTSDPFARTAQPAVDALAALERYLDQLRNVRRRSVHTLRNYRTDVGDFLAFLAERDVAYLDAGRGHGRAYLAELRTRALADASIKRRATTVRAFYG
ncbi:MAG: site-specific integrase, partial [Dehalococcoidia bacterium]